MVDKVGIMHSARLADIGRLDFLEFRDWSSITGMGSPRCSPSIAHEKISLIYQNERLARRTRRWGPSEVLPLHTKQKKKGGGHNLKLWGSFNMVL